MGSAPMKILFSCEDFSEKSFASLINRARRRARAREAIKPYLCSLWMVAITAKRTAIHRTRRRQEGEVLALLIAGRGDVARSAFPQDRRPTKQTERSGQPNPVQLVRPRFEHEHDAAVATLWRTLARCEETPRGWPRRRPCEVGTSTRTIWLRSSALRLCGESVPSAAWHQLRPKNSGCQLVSWRYIPGSLCQNRLRDAKPRRRSRSASK